MVKFFHVHVIITQMIKRFLGFSEREYFAPYFTRTCHQLSYRKSFSLDHITIIYSSKIWFILWSESTFFQAVSSFGFWNQNFRQTFVPDHAYSIPNTFNSLLFNHQFSCRLNRPRSYPDAVLWERFPERPQSAQSNSKQIRTMKPEKCSAQVERRILAKYMNLPKAFFATSGDLCSR